MHCYFNHSLSPELQGIDISMVSYDGIIYASLDWIAGLDRWTGPVDWTGGLSLLCSQNRLIVCNVLHSCMMCYNNPKTQPSISLHGLGASN